MHRLAGALAIPVLALAVACSGSQPEPEHEKKNVVLEHRPAPAPEAVEASADLEPRSGSSVTGHAHFTYADGQVTLTLQVENATPGEHAFHIHETGDCSAEDGSSAGGHWNPAGEEHGMWGHPPFHLGDVGNLTVGEDGRGGLTLTTGLWSIGTGKPGDILGHALIVHAGVDDFTTQPTGNAGGRVACGVIR